MIRLKPAKSFYLLLTQEEASKGKENQKRDLDVLKWFSNELPECTDRIQLLLEGMYWPQEALGTEKLKNAWEQLYGD